MTSPIDLDFNAGSSPDPRVVEAMHALGPHADGNPHAPHALGRAARAVLEDARERIAAVVGRAADEIVFCSGGTEANNIALACARASASSCELPIGLTEIEHPSLDAPARALAEERPDMLRWIEWRPEDGALDVEAAGPLAFVSCTLAQGEFGFVQDLADIRQRARQAHAACRLHSDASQALGRLDLAQASESVDLLTLSPHKAGGPRGVGVLVLREGARFGPALRGGSQELGRRPGTQVPRLAHGAAFSIELACAEWRARSAAMREAMECFLSAIEAERRSAQVQVLGEDLLRVDASKLLANTRTLVLSGIEARVFLPALDFEGVAISYGSACTSGALEPSKALISLGLERSVAASCVRVSVGPDVDCEKVEQAAALFSQVLARICRLANASSR